MHDHQNSDMKTTGNRMLASTAQQTLAKVWYSGAGLLFLAVIILTAFAGHEMGRMKPMDIWNWFLPTIVPTLSLIIGILVVDGVTERSSSRTVSRFLFQLSFRLSVAYLVALAIVLALIFMPSVPGGLTIKQSSLWLGPFQGLVTAALGVFFVQRQKDGVES